MHRREFVFSAGAALSAATLASGLGAALAQEAPATPATPEPAAPAAAPKPFGFEDVAEMARDLASKPYAYRDAELVGVGR